MRKFGFLVAFVMLTGTAAVVRTAETPSPRTDEPVPLWAVTVLADNTLPPSEGKLLEFPWPDLKLLPRPAPYDDITVGRRLPDGSLWFGSKHGLIYRETKQSHWRLFHSRRWLPDDHVLDLSVTKDGVYVKTSKGNCRIFQEKKSLDQKMAEIHAVLRRCHVREGLIGIINLNKPGTLDAGWFQPDSDNDGLWTSLYVGAEAFRFGATGDPEARKNAWQSLQALMFLEKVTGRPGFVARSILPISHPFPKFGEWHSAADGKWWWKGDTSCDELDGHFFAYATYFDVAATPEQKELIRPVVARIMNHIIDHGYYFVGPSGKPTRWGVWAPEKLNRELEWVGDRGLNSLELLTYLKIADHIVGDPRYAKAARELIDKHGYALNTIFQKHIWPPVTNHSDDEMAFLLYYSLLRYEKDPKLRAIYRASLERSWPIERPEHSPFFNFVYAACRQASLRGDTSRRPERSGVLDKDYDLEICIDWFRNVPQDLIEWTVKNSDRQDLGEVIVNRQRRVSSTRVLDISERHLMRWNGDPYQLDGGNDGRGREDGTFILLPYWMGKYHRFLK